MWKIPKIWKGGECWIIGGGPSVPYQFDVPEDIIDKVSKGILPVSAYSPYLSSIHDKHVIGVNMAYRIGDWIEIVVFGDRKFYLHNRHDLAQFPGLKIGVNPVLNHRRYIDEGVKCVSRDGGRALGLTKRSNHVSWNGNTGCAAISLAAQFGVKRVYLLGFDMDILDGNQHWHNLYKLKNNRPANKLPFNRHKKGFPNIKKDANRLGIEIINCSPKSTIQEFKKVSVKEVLNEHF